MTRLLRISLDILLMSALPIVMWILLGVIINKDITNVFTITYPIQFIIILLVSIFGTGANVNQTKNKKEGIVDSNIILGTLVGLAIIIILFFNIDRYIGFMNIENVGLYRNFCIYSITLMYLQFIIKLISQKLYYKNEIKNSNRLTFIFNIVNLLLIIGLALLLKDDYYSIIITLLIDFIGMIVVFVINVKEFKFSFDIIKNMKYVSNDIFDSLGMFAIYFIGFRTTLEFGTMFLVAINFETLIMDTQWDMSDSIRTAATIDASKNKVEYKKSIKDAYKLVALLLLSSFIMGSVLYFFYKPELWVIAILVGVQWFDLIIIPTIWIKQQYFQINYSAKKNTFHQGVAKCLRIFTSFIPTPFCTYIGQLLSIFYQVIIYAFVYKKKFYIENGLLKMYYKSDK